MAGSAGAGSGSGYARQHRRQRRKRALASTCSGLDGAGRSFEMGVLSYCSGLATTGRPVQFGPDRGGPNRKTQCLSLCHCR